MRAIDKAKQLLLRILGAHAREEQPDTDLISDFQEELSKARRHEANEFQAAALEQIAVFQTIPEDATFILYPSKDGYKPTVLGPFDDEEQAKKYITIKRGQQRANHQEYFSREGARPRHDGDLFIVGEPELVKKAAITFIKMQEFLDLSRGIAFDRNLWEMETYRAMGDVSESDGEVMPADPFGISRRQATLADAITVVIHKPAGALEKTDAAP